MSKLKNFRFSFDDNNIKGIYISNNVLYINTESGYKKFFLPNFFFYKKLKNGIKFIFDNYYKYNMVLRQLKHIIFNSSRIYFFKLKLRGLGYKVYTYVGRRIVRFFFAFNHFFYLHIPNGIFFKKLKRKFFFFSNNLPILNDLFSNILKLKKIDFYERANTFIVPKKILYIKKRK
jgi:hypothetical protein